MRSSPFESTNGYMPPRRKGSVPAFMGVPVPDDVYHMPYCVPGPIPEPVDFVSPGPGPADCVPLIKVPLVICSKPCLNVSSEEEETEAPGLLKPIVLSRE